MIISNLGTLCKCHHVGPYSLTYRNSKSSVKIMQCIAQANKCSLLFCPASHQPLSTCQLHLLPARTTPAKDCDEMPDYYIESDKQLRRKLLDLKCLRMRFENGEPVIQHK